MKSKDVLRLEKRVRKLEDTISKFMDEVGPHVQRKRAERDALNTSSSHQEGYSENIPTHQNMGQRRLVYCSKGSFSYVFAPFGQPSASINPTHSTIQPARMSQSS